MPVLLLAIACTCLVGTTSEAHSGSTKLAQAAQRMREGSAHGAAGRHEEAAAAFAEAAVLQPQKADVHSYLGSALASSGRVQEAIVATAAAAALSPRDVGVLIHHGSLLQNSVDPPPSAMVGQQELIDQRLRDAMQVFQIARDLAPQNPTAWMNSGIVAVQLSHDGTDEEMAVSAIEYARRAVQLDPNPLGNTEKVLASAWEKTGSSELRACGLQSVQFGVSASFRSSLATHMCEHFCVHVRFRYESLALLSPWFVQGTVLLFDDWLVRQFRTGHRRPSPWRTSCRFSSTSYSIALSLAVPTLRWLVHFRAYVLVSRWLGTGRIESLARTGGRTGNQLRVCVLSYAEGAHCNHRPWS
eukprot:COSAG02_NODE_485_length_21365_cov_9.452584_3_plen_357_part_00